MQRQENNEPGYAGFFVRLAAYLADTLIIGIGSLFIRASGLFWNIGSTPLSVPVLFQYTIGDILFYLLGAAYYILMTYSAGATLGKRIFNLQVVSADGEKLAFFQVLYRETIGKYLSGVIMNAGYIAVGVDIEKRGFHDMLSDTRVTYNLKPRYGTYSPYNGGNKNTSYDGRQQETSQGQHPLAPPEASAWTSQKKDPFSPPPYANDQNPPWKKKEENQAENWKKNQLERNSETHLETNQEKKTETGLESNQETNPETSQETRPEDVHWNSPKEPDENKKN